MKGRVTDMRHHVAIATLLTLSAVLGGHLQETVGLLGQPQPSSGHLEITASSSEDEDAKLDIAGNTSLSARKSLDDFQHSSLNSGGDNLPPSQEVSPANQDFEVASSLELTPSPTQESSKITLDEESSVDLLKSFNSPVDHDGGNIPSNVKSGLDESPSPPPFKPSPRDPYIASQDDTELQVTSTVNNNSSGTSSPRINSTGVDSESTTSTLEENAATLSQEDFNNNMLARFSFDALQATQIAERLGIAGSGITELEREFAYDGHNFEEPDGYGNRPHALPLQRNVRKTPQRKRHADFNQSTRRFFLGDPALCYSGSCEFFLFCWLSGGLIDGGCGGFLFACCTRQNQRGQRGHESYRDDSSGVIPVDYGPVRNDNACGLSASSRLSAQRRIVGGTEAGFGSFPWQAYIRIGSSRCGGSLINQYHVVTAGHCVARARPSQIRVTLGDYVLNSNQEPLDPHVYGASDIKVHPNFKFTPQADRFDVAVITLDSPVRYEPHIQPICLPEKGTDWLGSYAFAAGWGALESGSRARPKKLQVVDVPILDSRLCEDWHRQKGINVIIYDEMMCAGYAQGGRDSCQGDSGGPLMIQDSGRWYLAGIVSAGYSCAEVKQPGIYHKVSYTTDWISWAANS
ncbi:uncharacterized protein [Palaemon carinicauda]